MTQQFFSVFFLPPPSCCWSFPGPLISRLVVSVPAPLQRRLSATLVNQSCGGIFVGVRSQFVNTGPCANAAACVTNQRKLAVTSAQSAQYVQSTYGTSPQGLSHLLQPYTPIRQLRSASDIRAFVTPRVNTETW